MQSQRHIIEPNFQRDRYLNEAKRVDARGFDDFRPMSVQKAIISHAHGSAIVRHGNTSVIASLTGQLCNPDKTAPGLGFITVNIEAIPGLQPADALSADIVRTTDLLRSIFAKSDGGVISRQALCIKEGKLAWCLGLDVMCLDYDGARLADCTLAGVFMALLSTRLPRVTVVEETEDIEVDMNNKTCDPKIVQEVPVCSTFAQLNGGRLLVDPTLEELEMFPNCVSICATGKDRMIAVELSGKLPACPEFMQTCFQRAAKRQKTIDALLKST